MTGKRLKRCMYFFNKYAGRAAYIFWIVYHMMTAAVVMATTDGWEPHMTSNS
jgi:hypothetical protein